MAEGKLENEPKPSINASRSLRLAMFLPFFASRFMLIALKRTMKSEGAGKKNKTRHNPAEWHATAESLFCNTNTLV